MKPFIPFPVDWRAGSAEATEAEAFPAYGDSVDRFTEPAGWRAGRGWGKVGQLPPSMVIILTVIALLIQFVGVYALIIHTQRTQEAQSEVAPACQRGRQAYYNAFAEQQAKRASERSEVA